jgi:endonuclease-8
MPEGDTIHRAAETLHRALAGKVVMRFESVLPALTRVHEDTPLTGRTVEEVRARGKHLLLRFSGGHVLRTHMRMNGSWHIYRPGERWQRARRDMRIVIATADYEAVAFNVPVAELLTERTLFRHPELRALGPDLLEDDFDRREAGRRLAAKASVPIADALLNQQVMAGIGNVYKSEVLFACGVNPFMVVGQLSETQIDRLIDTARQYLRVNASGRLAPMTTYTGYRRTTRRDDPGERLWVYGRARRPCRRCGAPIRVRRHGPAARLTYWCPRCQPEGMDRSRQSWSDASRR